jgi:hypothetical protein
MHAVCVSSNKTSVHCIFQLDEQKNAFTAGVMRQTHPSSKMRHYAKQVK